MTLALFYLLFFFFKFSLVIIKLYKNKKKNKYERILFFHRDTNDRLRWKKWAFKVNLGRTEKLSSYYHTI